jgi:predicted nucleic acid-binding protein
MPEVIFDCCVISNFALAGSLDVIKVMYGNKAFIMNFVFVEIMRGIQIGLANLKLIQEALKNGWLKETELKASEEKALFESLSVSLGLGEASCIAVAKKRALLFACDDRAARREASLLGIKLTGTLGILKKAIKRKIINLKKADLILRAMIEHGFRSPVKSLKEITEA